MEKIKTYSEMYELKTFEERFEYLSLNGRVGSETFGFDRYLNQKLYQSKEWKDVRDMVIIRDNGCDLGVDGVDIFGTIQVHHMNPISTEDIKHSSEFLLNPEYLITTSIDTHKAIHYGNSDYLNRNKIVERKPNDHCPWRK
ncbi:MAG: hypothetical protein ACNA7U_03835 [Candidatus Izemoplasmataceae bacterium]